MTKLTYIFTAPDGNKVEVGNYPQVLALVERYGGSYIARYTPLREINKVETEEQRAKRLARIAKQDAARHERLAKA